jgi:hypothetical protein
MRFPTAIAAIAVAALLTSTTAAVATPSTDSRHAPSVRFSKVVYDSPGADTGSNPSLNAEWAQVTNFSASGRVLTGWTIRDTSGHIYRFPTFTLRAGKAVRLHTGRGANTATDLYWRQDGYVWNNSGDTAILRNRLGTNIDRCSWSGSGSSTNC